MNPNPQNIPSPVIDSTPEQPSKNYDNALPDANNSDRANSVPRKRQTLDSDDSRIGKILEGVKVGHDKLSPGKVVADPSSVPGFLKDLLTQEFGDDVSKNLHKLVVIATHAVMLECGFVQFDKISNSVAFGFRSPSCGPFYTLPERNNALGKYIKNVVLQFQSSEEYSTEYSVTVNGRLESESNTYSVQFKKKQLVQFMNNVVNDKIGGKDQVFRFWKKIKDNLVLPLLKDLRQVSCSCNKLPIELKLEILKWLSVGDLANVSCICYDLESLASSEELWKMKFVKEFGNVDKGTCLSWRKAFARAARKRRINNNNNNNNIN